LGPSASGSIIDFAVTSNAIAIIGPDHSLKVYRVPLRWNSDDPHCEKLAHIPSTVMSLGDQSFGALNQVEWVRRQDEDWLAIGAPHGVIIVNPRELNSEGSTDLEDLLRMNKILKTDGVSDCDFS